VLILSLLSCIDASATPPEDVAASMHSRFAALTAARDHVIGGRLAEAHSSGAALRASTESAPSDPTWARWLARLGKDADRIASARDLAQAALGVGVAAQTCGECHAAQQGGPPLTGADGIPTQSWSEGTNMALHRWSMDWMWVGLVAHDDAAWLRGAKSLDDKPLAFRFQGTPPPTHQPQLEQGVYMIAGLAIAAPAAERGALMGQLIGTCAQCHAERGE